MTDGLADPSPTGELGRSDDIPNNVFALRARLGTDKNPGHPSGPRVQPNRSHDDDSVDRALYTLRSSRPGPANAHFVSARPDASAMMRSALAAVAVVQLIIGLAWLVGKVPFGRIVGSPTAGHLARDAALGVVLGSIGLIVAWRPRWSLSLVPVVGAIVAVQAIGLASDVSRGQSGFLFEFPHALAVILGVLTFRVTHRRRYPEAAH